MIILISSQFQYILQYNIFANTLTFTDTDISKIQFGKTNVWVLAKYNRYLIHLPNPSRDKYC